MKPLFLVLAVLIAQVFAMNEFGRLLLEQDPSKWSSWMAGPACPRRAGRVLVPFASQPAPQQQAITNALASVSSLVDSLVYNYSTVYNLHFGANLGVIYGDKVLLTHGAGVTQQGSSGTVPTADTIFSMGSVSKIFASLLMMKLLDDGVITSLDQPVTDFFNTQHPPAFSPLNPYGDGSLRGLSLRSLATHTSGLPREPVCTSYDLCPTGSQTIEELIIQTINQIPLFSAPLTVPHYSNLGTGLLSRCLERAFNFKMKSESWIKYEDLLLVEVLQRLGMNNTGFNYTQDVKDRMAVGYTVTGTKQTVDPMWAKELGWTTACGGMHSTTNDMLRFMANALRPSVHSARKQQGVLSHASQQLYGSQGIEMPDGVSGFGLGTFEKVFAGGYQVLTKGGLTGGFGTSLVYVPELELGIIVWINLQSGTIPDEISAKAFNLIVPVLDSAIIASQQPQQILPVGCQSIYGAYGISSPLVVINETGPRILRGNVLNYPVVFTWEPEMSSINVIAMRYRFDLPQGREASCLMLDSLGEDAVVFFTLTQGTVIANVPDMAIWNIPKMK